MKPNQRFGYRRFFSACLLISIWICGLSVNCPVKGADHLDNNEIQIGGGAIHLILGADLPVKPDAIHDWVTRAGTAVSDFYGQYPVRNVSLHIGSADSGAVRDGVENNGDRITINLGKQTSPSSMANDWMLTHEMFHLSQPSLDDSYSWMSEGMADYLEPVARVRIGQISKEQFWKDLVEGMPQGLPEKGDRGLDRTHSWGRTYWGGCLFWLMADLQIRQQTHNTRSVRDAALAVLNAGGDGSQEWTIDRLLSTYDTGTGTKVFQSLHDQMGNKAVPTDLNALWKSLGIEHSEKSGTINFDDHAKLAEIRQNITARKV